MKIIFSVILVFVLVLTMPLTTAFADDEVSVNCDLIFGAVLPGVDVVDEDEITNSGQVAIATVNFLSSR